VSDWLTKWMNEWMNGWMNEWKNEWMYRMSEWVNEWIKKKWKHKNNLGCIFLLTDFKSKFKFRLKNFNIVLTAYKSRQTRQQRGKLMCDFIIIIVSVIIFSFRNAPKSHQHANKITANLSLNNHHIKYRLLSDKIFIGW